MKRPRLWDISNLDDNLLKFSFGHRLNGKSSIMAVWGENWSSGSDTDESGSSYHSDDSSQSGRMESARILGETFHFPQGLCDNPEIFKEVLSIDTWNNFTPEQRQHLEVSPDLHVLIFLRLKG
ncbi:hypothetical protein GE061_012472 [Apolygus lucorum]|uniref:Uncharacterized protein n=1 Tax=Apolygus lucorum TaxID=248454 RepID=A0A8S9XWH4_APOLU|nr:hypothetical protein GE061_012472 [Apolygus lucorum]